MKKTFFLGLSSLLLASAAPAQHWSLTWKKMQAVSPGLEQIGSLSAASSRELANPRWSVGCECLDREYADFSAYKPYVGELGVGAARIQSGWARCEQKKGKYEFGWLDEAVDGLCEQGIRPWMCLAYGNPVYGAQKSLGSRIFTDEETLRAWERYVTAVARRYKGRVSEWEVWNEPNLRGADQSAAYAELLIRTAEAVRKVDPEAVIIGFGLSRMPLGFTGRVLDIVRERGKLDLIDYVSFHPYYENPDDATPGIEALAELVASYDPRIRLFSGESGCPAVLEWAHALRYHEWSEYSQAKWVVRRLANDFALGIRSSIFAIADNQYPNMLQSFGLLRTNLLKQVVYKRPSYHAMQHMVNLLHRGVKPAGRLAFTANTARETVGCRRQADRRDVLVLRPHSGRRTGLGPHRDERRGAFAGRPRARGRRHGPRLRPAAAPRQPRRRPYETDRMPGVGRSDAADRAQRRAVPRRSRRTQGRRNPSGYALLTQLFR